MSKKLDKQENLPGNPENKSIKVFDMKSLKVRMQLAENELKHNKEIAKKKEEEEVA